VPHHPSLESALPSESLIVLNVHYSVLDVSRQIDLGHCGFFIAAKPAE
jgi:hypothetical protein